jgi:prepilin-type N-terminal cleavage/methylation domain-containing protein
MYMMVKKLIDKDKCPYPGLKRFIRNFRGYAIDYRSEKGFTLIELLVVMPILSVVMGVMAMTIIMMIKVGSQNNDYALSLSQVQNAGYWITRDVMNGQTVSPQPEEGILLTVEWNDWDNTHYKIDYVWDGNKLRREINENSPGTLVAQYIVIGDTTFEADPESDNQYQLTVKAAQGNAEVERTYRAMVRVPVDEGS